MPDPLRVLRTIKQATRAFQQVPSRRGRFVHLQEASGVLVVGDLHGNVENFRLLLERAQLQMNPRRHLVVQELVHGRHRYPAGGDKSHQLVDLLAALKCQYPLQVHVLLGNHELSQWTRQAIAKADDELNALFREGVATAYGPQARQIYEAYGELFASVPIAIQTPNRVFLSHSLPSAGQLARFDPAALARDSSGANDLRRGGSIHALLWGRDTSRENAAHFLHKVDADFMITGHIACAEGYLVPNDWQIILDAVGSPACYCLFPVDRPLTQGELINCIGTL